MEGVIHDFTQQLTEQTDWLQTFGDLCQRYGYIVTHQNIEQELHLLVTRVKELLAKLVKNSCIVYQQPFTVLYLSGPQRAVVPRKGTRLPFNVELRYFLVILLDRGSYMPVRLFFSICTRRYVRHNVIVEAVLITYARITAS